MSKARFVVAIFAILVASPLLAQIKNAGFEIARSDDAEQPADWTAVGDGGEMCLDVSVKHDGDRSVRLRKRPGAWFTGIGQSLDATTFRGKIIVLRGWMRAEDVDGNAGLWLRADATEVDHRGFVNDYRRPVGVSEWTQRRVMLDVAPRAERIVFGAALFSDKGSIWIDSLEISEIDSASAQPLEGAANDYFEEALQVIRANALNSDRTDWAAVIPRAKLFASGAKTPQETHAAISQLLLALKDRHSFLLPAADVRIWREDTNMDFGIVSAVVAHKGYVRVPEFRGGNVERDRAFAADLEARITAQQSAKVCGWIVDLREDTGGNMDPMLAGLSAMLGDGILGYFVDKDGRRPWSHKRFYDDTGVTPATQWPLLEAPVAVLTGPRTSSSGEAVVISFRSRPRTRFFGSSTSGQTTANRGFRLSDGSMILLAVSREADRTGKIYDTAIVPDEVVQAPAAGGMLADDPVVKAATRWLDTQEPCAR